MSVNQIKLGTATTLDEPISETIVRILSNCLCWCLLIFFIMQLRDLRQVASKLKVVLLPLGKDSQSDVLSKLREC